MLDAFIIEELKRRERERQEDRRPVLELPIDRPPNQHPGQDPRRREEGEPTDHRDRDVVIIQM